MKSPLTVLVTTRNEEVNLERCLVSVREWADQLFVLDSESTDGTSRRTERSHPIEVASPMDVVSISRSRRSGVMK